MQSQNNTNTNISQNMQQHSFKPVAVYFKEVYTTNTKMYQIYPDWTLKTFINAISPIICIDFNMELDKFDIIEMGQEEEEGAFGLGEFDMILREFWTPELNVSFYIRRHQGH